MPSGPSGAGYPVGVRVLSSIDELEAANRLASELWGGGQDAMPINLLKALAHAGHYVSGAYLDGALVGTSMGFVWARRAALHSHITGVAPGAQGTGIGYALKQHQRRWAARMGLDVVTWTFDPLVRRNAYFNLVKLGARITEYHPEFYGTMTDAINAGDPSDRCVVEWPADPSSTGPALAVSEPGVATCESGAAIPESGVALRCGASGEPVVGVVDGPVVIVQTPPDAVALRGSDPGLAQEWRLALRATLGEAMSAGYRVVAFTADGSYVLERGVS